MLEKMLEIWMAVSVPKCWMLEWALDCMSHQLFQQIITGLSLFFFQIFSCAAFSLILSLYFASIFLNHSAFTYRNGRSVATIPPRTLFLDSLLFFIKSLSSTS